MVPTLYRRLEIVLKHIEYSQERFNRFIDLSSLKRIVRPTFEISVCKGFIPYLLPKTLEGRCFGAGRTYWASVILPLQKRRKAEKFGAGDVRLYTLGLWRNYSPFY